MYDVARAEHLRHVIDHAAHLLPAQGPITVFVHHNTLHAFEESTFFDAVLQGAKRFGGRPFLEEDQYRAEMQRGRIRPEDLDAVLIDDLGERADVLLGFLGTRFELRRAILQKTLRSASSAELRWLVAETDALKHFHRDVPAELRDQVVRETRHWVLRDIRNNGNGNSTPPMNATRELIQEFGTSTIERWSDKTWESFCLHLLWRVCHQGVHGVKRFQDLPPPLIRHRDLLHEATGEDTDRLVHEVMIRLCATFLDQGLAHWPLPERERGFFASFLALYGQRLGPPNRWLRGLSAELRRLADAGRSPLESIAESLDQLGVEPHEEEEFLIQTFLALRGWAGMVYQTETRGDRVFRPSPSGTLAEFLAVRLVLERLVVAAVARETLGYRGPLAELRTRLRGRLPRHDAVHLDQRAFVVFQLAQFRGWSPEELSRLTKPEWSRLIQELEAFSGIERRRIFHLAFERRFRTQVLDALAVHTDWLSRNRADERPPDAPPKFQAITCIDDREESFRRYLEEIEPACETFGAAGFFAVAMYYRGAADAYSVPLCPIIIKPKHHVREEVPYTHLEEYRRRTRLRRLVGRRSFGFHRTSRTFLGGAIAALVGPLASVPLIARILYPRLTAQFRRAVGRFVEPPPVTHLTLERDPATPGPGAEFPGYTIAEMADVVERLLRDIGLTRSFARLVLVLGHGSSSLNNPHESAYNCGACGGGRGGPNARSLARMANEPRVRDLLASRGLALPAATYFVGGYHNTCDDGVTFFDLDRLPSTHAADFDHARRTIDRARERNAHERARRFASAELYLSPEAALRHVEARAEDLSQTRPEYNHATNAVCIVGRRARTRGLFLDRRSFLVSYDPHQDDTDRSRSHLAPRDVPFENQRRWHEAHLAERDGYIDRSILARILGAVVPVCAGINLEYYFSTVDVKEYGCGTKLPHNVTSLLGVMDGAASDLRTGLSAQMTEIHEPVRLLFVIETEPATMLRIMAANPVIGRLCGNGWVQVATLDPNSADIHVLCGGEFVRHRPERTTLPEVKQSSDWYRGWRDHLEFAHVKKAADKATRGKTES